MWDVTVVGIRFVACMAVGFFLPGYFITRLLGASQRWASAFLLSLLVLFQVIFWVEVVGLPVRAEVVWAVEMVVTLGLGARLRWRKKSAGGKSVPVAPVTKITTNSLAAATVIESPRWWLYLPIIGLCLVGVALLWRIWQFPLDGPDTSFRWDHLARRMLEQSSFSFYPPVSAADYRVYFYCDGIPPLVSFAYWWIYASIGKVMGSLTSPLVVMQYLAVGAFVYGIGRRLHSPLAGALGVGMLAGAVTFARSIFMAQETGYLAMSAAGMSYFLLQWRQDKKWQTLVLAALAGALGALSREYGWAFVAYGVAVVVVLRGGWKAAGLFVLVCLLMGVAWYIRNYLRTGHLLGLYFNTPIHAACVQYYHKSILSSILRRSEIMLMGWTILQQVPWQATVGLLALVMLVRRGWIVCGLAVGVFLLWAMSVPNTSGGWKIALRVLAPGVALLSALGGAMLAKWSSRRVAGHIIVGLVCLGCLWGTATTLAFPNYPDMPAALKDLPEAALSKRPAERGSGDKVLNNLLPSGSRILTDNAFLHASLYGGPLEVVPVWSPEVAFLTDDSLSTDDIRRLLQKRHIEFVFFGETGLNAAFLMENIKLYREDSGFWKVVTSGGGGNYIFKLPPPRTKRPPSDSAFIEARLKQGREFCSHDDHAKALQALNDVLEADGNYADAYVLRGNVLMATNRFEEAVRDYTKAIALKPDFREAFALRGLVYLKEERFAEAVADCNRAIELHLDWDFAWGVRGRAYKELHEEARAEADMQTFRKMHGQSEDN